MMTRLTPQIKNLLKQPINFSHLLDEIPISIAIFDLNYNIVYLNRTFEALTGFSLTKAYGMPCRNVLRSKSCIINCPIASIEAESQPAVLESDIINLDRQRLPVRITVAPVLNIKGEITCYIETLEDLRSIKNLDTQKQMAYSFADIIGRSPQMERIFQTIPILAQSDVSIMITGETGTGKDLVAEAIHQTSSRANGPFIKINCGALPETLLESEIFGHQKGAFTGANENKPGRFKLAHNGTIFLTEIGDLPLSLQVKLLTFLDDKVIFPLGSTKGFNVNVKMVVATHRNLEQMVKDGLFRQDLFFRLNVARIHLPPLVEREGDIRLLLDHFLATYAKKLNRTINCFSNDVLNFLLQYNYQGNIRELNNIVEYAANITNSSVIKIEDLPSYLFDQQVTLTTKEEAYGDHSLVSGTTRLVKNENTPTTWAKAEKDMIINTLLAAKGKKSQAAKMLGWGRSKLWRKMKYYEMS
jgi:two-component system, NtrC family, response regulator AtoC